MLLYQQSFNKSLGDYGCYFFCLLRIAEDYTGQTLDVPTVVQILSNHRSQGRQWLAFNWNDYSDAANFDVNCPCEILEVLTGKKWSVQRIDAASYKRKSGEYVVQRWFNKATGRGHFRMIDFDSLQNSLTVKNGKIDSFRVFKVVD